jgi:selenide,water dikinase
VAPSFALAEGVAPELVTLAHDPQTSGGLLAAVPADRLDAIEDALDGASVEHWRVGTVYAASEPGVILR